ncbi:hypothetical protein HPB50_011748 [Hyalomma asiaticum]|uniref:Uncharacterized protein n=1 Tax=Hyalomma asiaticum TaxID=266040 RepID=A0ACB7TGG2_HYAAI|nr:hypothetical protein HPB50_011748 [Hyalomma asiaticum]
MMHVMLVAACLFLLFIHTTTGYSYEEKDFHCHGTILPATSVCDGTRDCTAPDDVPNDESPDICAPSSYLGLEASLEIHNVTSTSALLSWTMTAAHDPEDSLMLAGYFLTGKSEPHSFQNVISGQLLSHHAQWLKPWTNYTLILRPFYTETGRPHRQYKVGKAASAQVRTLSTQPEAPSLVTVLSAQQRNVVLNIVGPSSWNSAPVGFSLHWQATSESRGQRGILEAPLTADWTPQENALNVTLPLQGGIDYTISVRAIGKDSSGAIVRGPDVEVDVGVTLDSYDISAYPINSSKAIISWRISEGADFYVGHRDLTYETTLEINGTGKVPSRNSIVIDDLQSWKRYVVTVQGCNESSCSDAVHTTFDTLPEDFPSPTLTNVAATSNSSFEIDWTFPQHDIRLYDGFRVLYCLNDQEPCFVLRTKKNNVTVRGLAHNSTFEIYVQAQWTSYDGRSLLGPVATASITTWSDVPVLRAKHAANMQESYSCVIQWTCANSSIDYLQELSQHGGNGHQEDLERMSKKDKESVYDVRPVAYPGLARALRVQLSRSEAYVEVPQRQADYQEPVEERKSPLKQNRRDFSPSYRRVEDCRILVLHQYKTRADDYWNTCDNSANCDVTFFRERTATFASGYIRFGHEAQYGYNEVFVRACNSYGCGPESSVAVSADVIAGRAGIARNKCELERVRHLPWPPRWSAAVRCRSQSRRPRACESAAWCGR